MAQHVAIYGEVLSIRVALPELPTTNEAASLRLLQHEEVSAGGGWFRLPPPAHGVLINADSITMDAALDLGQASVRNRLYSVVLPGLIKNRGGTVLRGTAILWHGNAYLLLGLTSTGKSSGAALLLQSGASLLSEDAVVIARDSAGGLVVHTGAPFLKLWPGSDPNDQSIGDDLGPVAPGVRKRIFRIPRVDSRMTAPVAGAVVLVPGHKRNETRRITPSENLPALNELTWPSFPGHHPHAAREVFLTLCAMARSVPTLVVRRPVIEATAEAAAAAIIAGKAFQ